MIIAHISDPHITINPTASDAEAPSVRRLEQAVAHLLRLPNQPDVVLVTGDCVHRGLPEEYALFQEILRPLSMPVYVVPGNHDHRDYMLEYFGTQGKAPLEGFVQYVVDKFPVRLIALDTHVLRSDEGYLQAEQLLWLEERLAEEPQRPTMLFMHHPPFLVGLDVVDDIRLLNAEELEAIVVRHPQIERILTGHLHMAITARFANTIVQGCPAMGQSLLPDLAQPQQLVVQMEPPACLIHTWSETTGLFSYTSIIGEHGPAITLHDGRVWVS